jgi:hypothetical protein
MVNRREPHILVLPEDDANRQLAYGFLVEVVLKRQKQMQVLPEAGGWKEVLRRFNRDEVKGMEKWPYRFMVLLIDFDKREDRLDTAKAAIPNHLADRVFVLGVWSKPEVLRASLGSYETIGSALAKDCRNNTYATWRHSLLHHNRCELARLRKHVRPILF